MEKPSILKDYYRLPGLTVSLPTRGRFLPEGAITLTEQGEVAVFPMVAADEMMLKNPDALMSGSAIQSLFESCVPSIKTPALISSPDIDVLLLAIRVATYGRTMELEAICPACEKELSFDCDLPSMLASVADSTAEPVLRLNDSITVVIRPFNVSDLAFMSRKIFEEERRLQQIEMSEDLTDEQRQIQRNLLFKRMSSLQSDMLSNTVVKVVTPVGEETDAEAIRQFLANIPTTELKTIDTTQKDVGQGGLDKTIAAKCEYCEHEWRTMVDFDPTSFFDQNSSS
jgi:hypothetical protein